MQQWVSQVEEQAAAGEAEVVGAAMVEAALEAAAMAEAAAVVDAAEMAEAAEMAVVWDTTETAARRPEIVIEEQPEQSEQGAEGAQEGLMNERSWRMSSTVVGFCSAKGPSASDAALSLSWSMTTVLMEPWSSPDQVPICCFRTPATTLLLKAG